MVQNSILEAALAYLRRGWSVIPLRQRDKRPILPSWQEYQSRRPTEGEVRAWWDHWPEANAGVVTGLVSGVVVLDLDGSDAVEIVKARGMPETPVAATWKGWHVYLAYPVPGPVPNAVRVLGNMDVRGDGGYVVVPPSLHPSGRRYVWAKKRSPDDVPLAPPPNWLLEALRSARVPPPPPAGAGRDPAWVLELLVGVEEGRRNDAAARLVGHWLARLPPEEAWALLVDWNQRNRPPLDERELRGVFDSIARREAARPRPRPRPDAAPRLPGRVAVPEGWDRRVVVVAADWAAAREAYTQGEAVVVVYDDGTVPPEAAELLRAAGTVEVAGDDQTRERVEWLLYPLLAARVHGVGEARQVEPKRPTGVPGVPDVGTEVDAGESQELQERRKSGGAEAEGETGEPTPPPDCRAVSTPRVCYRCGGARFWRSVYGAVVCATCHPPATPELVAEYVCVAVA